MQAYFYVFWKIQQEKLFWSFRRYKLKRNQGMYKIGGKQHQKKKDKFYLWLRAKILAENRQKVWTDSWQRQTWGKIVDSARGWKKHMEI